MKDNREKLEVAAQNAVQRSGLKGLSFRTLADEIGIKSSSVHYHFPEKADLARVLIERYSESFFIALGEISAETWGLKRKVRAFIEIFESVAEEDKLCLCGMMASEIEQLGESNQKLLSQYFLRTEQWLTDLFDEYRDDIITPLNSKTLAKILLCGLEGALLLDRTVGDRQRLNSQKELVLSLLS